MKNFTIVAFLLLIAQSSSALNGNFPARKTKAVLWEASISYNSPICQSASSQPVLLIGDGGGTFFASPVGLAINATTGEISPGQSTPGVYTVTYTIPADEFNPALVATATVEILAQANAGTDGDITVCESSTAAIDLFSIITGEQSGGTWTRTAGTGGTFIVAAGTFTPAQGATTSFFTYTVSGSAPCVNDTSTVTITINAQTDAGTDGSITICDSSFATIDLFSIIAGEQSGGVWNQVGGTGGVFNQAAGTFTPALGSTSHFFTYTKQGTAPCVDDSSTATINVTSQFTAGIDGSVGICEGNFATINLFDVIIGEFSGGTWAQTGGTGGTFNAAQGTFTPSAGTTTSTFVYSVSGQAPCTDDWSAATVVVGTIQPTFSPFNTTFCVGAQVPFLPTTSDNGITGTWSPSIIDNTVVGNFIYTFTPDVTVPGQECAIPTSLSIFIGQCGGLQFVAFLDGNSNGIKDADEVNFPFGHFDYELNNDGVIHEITAPYGSHYVNDNVFSNSYDVTFGIYSPNDTVYNISTPSYTGISPAGGFPIYYFPVTVFQVSSEIQIDLVPFEAPRPGFTYTNKIVFTNNGNVPIANGSIAFTKDSAVTITEVSLPAFTTTATGFTVDFTDLAPFETRYIFVTMLVPPIPNVAIGQLLTNNVAVSAGSLIDGSSVTQQIIGSYDPNDKTESHGPQIVFSTFGADDYLYYTIRFENTGNASAINVEITDALDEQLDETSVRTVSASHNYTMERSDNNLTFTFNNIFLLPAIVDPIAAKGYVMFKVKPIPGFAIGDIIPNTASIYFDFNPAIVTNTFNTEFVNELATTKFGTGQFALYPNPAYDKIMVVAPNDSAISAIAITDVLGKMVKSINGNNKNTETVDIQSLHAGMYFIEVTTSDNLQAIKKLLVK